MVVMPFLVFGQVRLFFYLILISPSHFFSSFSPRSLISIETSLYKM
jgi:hypothetical protein